jgi:hypothetical protein
VASDIIRQGAQVRHQSDEALDRAKHPAIHSTIKCFHHAIWRWTGPVPPVRHVAPHWAKPLSVCPWRYLRKMFQRGKHGFGPPSAG